MARTVFLNADYMDETEAQVSIFDRGFLMADAVYEVTAVLDGKLVDFDAHMVRLQRSLDELGIAWKVDAAAMLDMHRHLVSENAIEHGGVYLQISRGNPGDRDFLMPEAGTCQPTIIAFTQQRPAPAADDELKGIHIITTEDKRWQRNDIKTVQLLYASLQKTRAVRNGADDAWMIRDGLVTEGTSNNVYIIKDDTIITRPLSDAILHGITRASVLRYASEHQLRVEERCFTLEEALAADEAFMTSASSYVTPVVQIDDTMLGDGKAGSVTRGVRAIYLEESRRRAI